ncbi:hypothetical protein BH20VER3_BH20VER3_02900 [soil metagenome]
MGGLLNDSLARKRARAAGRPLPMQKKRQSRARDSTRGQTGWNWREGLSVPPPRLRPIVPRGSREPVALSYGQQRLWFLAQLESGSAAYNVPMAWRITGALDPLVLQHSLDQLTPRHEALRTTFPAEGGDPRQVVTAPRPVVLNCVDLRRVEHSTRESELGRRIAEETQPPFDLATGPLLRTALFRLGQEEHVFVLVLHHIVCDGPSIAVLLDELALLYGSFASGAALHLSEPEVQYADFAIWQRAALIGDVRESQIHYWREQLRDCPAALDFPADRPQPFAVGFRGGMEYCHLSHDLSQDLRALARQQGVTRFMALLALFEVLLARHTGQEEICVGCPMTHRSRAEVARVMGFFANMMVLRSRLEGNPTFREFLRRTREVTLGAYAHQELPFEELVADLQPERVPGRNPFFQAMLVVEEASWRELHLPGLHCTTFPVHNGTAKFDFSLYVIDHPEGFRLGLEYNADRFDGGTARRLLEHFENLAREAVADPDCRVFDLPMLSDAERRRLLADGNAIQDGNGRIASVPQLFESQAERTPEATAVVCKGRKVSYRDLNERANRLAHHLISLGAGREVLVAICMERSLDLVVALLAVMKSGAAYLPLDPSHPHERRENILSESGAKLLLSSRNRTQDLDAGVSVVVLPAEEEARIARESDANPAVAIRPEDLVYVIYTSGSTGRPKGVQVEHGNLSNFLATMRKRPGLSANDILLAVTTIAFDIAGLELWLPLTTGASVVLASGEEVTDAPRLMILLKESKVTVMQATPATWQMLLAAGWRGDRRLQVLCGGEAVASTLADELLNRCRSVWNLYGPTETTIWSSIYKVKGGEGGVLPIGQPIGNTSMYVLDRRMEPVAVGIRGELYIGGAGVARGYAGAPSLTAEKFVSNPHSGEAKARLYRTGDLVRRRQDGTIEFLGRMDRQAKIRGYRIEPAEIEAVLQQYGSLKEVAVMVRGDLDAKQLVAYLVSADGSIDHAELVRFLEAKLPAYMVPSAFVNLSALPITPNGKLDWKRLPPPTHEAPRRAHLEPHDAIETRLIEFFEEILQVTPVGVTDNFFDLGGHSILATRLFARVAKYFGKQLPLGTLFEAPTVGKLAAVLRQSSWNSSSLIPVQAGNASLLPLFLIQARVGYRALATELGPEQPVYVVPTDNLFVHDTERSLSDLAVELAQVIRQRQPQGPYHLGGMCLAGRVAFAVARELCQRGEEVALLAIVDMSAPGYASRRPKALARRFIGRLFWHLRYALRGDGQQRMDWLTGGVRALRWQVKYRAWQLTRLGCRFLKKPLPQALRHTTRLIAEAARQDPATNYPGRITLFRPSEKTFHRDDSWALGWDRIAGLGVDVHEIPGLKRTLLRENAAAVGRRIRECLGRATADFDRAR